jgi:hypothetical protein
MNRMRRSAIIISVVVAVAAIASTAVALSNRSSSSGVRTVHRGETVVIDNAPPGLEVECVDGTLTARATVTPSSDSGQDTASESGDSLSLELSARADGGVIARCS